METRRLWEAWWSGALAVLAVGLLIRMGMSAPATHGVIMATEWIAWGLAIAAGIAATWLAGDAAVSRRREEPPTWVPGAGGFHPKARSRRGHEHNEYEEEPEEAPDYGMAAAIHPVGEERDDDMSEA